MKSSYRALIWEQARTAGAICLLLGVLSCLLIALVHFLRHRNAITPADARDVWVMICGFSAIGAALIVSRQDSRGHITWGLDSRWFRLPVPMFPLFGIVIGARVVFLALLLGLQTLLSLTLPRMTGHILLLCVLAPVCVFGVIQALTWSWKRAPVLFYGPVVVMLGIMLAFRQIGLSPQDILTVTGQTLLEPRLWALVPPLLLLFMTLGVYLERQDRYFGPTRVSAVFAQVSQWLSPSLKASATPFEAQLWYEMRRVSSLLPGLTLLFTVLFVLVMVLVEEHPLGSGLGQYVPLAALMAAGLVSGFKGLFPRSGLQNLRPMEDNDIAVARMLAQLRALCLATLLAAGLSLLLLLAGPVERSVLGQLMADDFSPTFDVFIVIMRPLVVAVMMTWLLLWLTAPPMTVALLTLAAFLGLASQVLQGYVPYLGLLVSVYGFITIPLVLALLLFLYTTLKGMISTRLCTVLTFLWAVFSSFAWFGSASLESLTGVFLACAWSALLVMPPAALAWFVKAQRHDVGIRRFRI